MRSFFPALFAVAWLATSGCVIGGSGGYCSRDADCGRGECAHNHECAPAGSLRGVTIYWSIDGQPAGELRCAPVAELRVTFEDEDLGDTLVYEPVPCRLGQINFDRVHPRFEHVLITAHGSADETLHSERHPMRSGDRELQIDIRP